MLSAKISRPLHQYVLQLGRLDILIALSDLVNIDVRSLFIVIMLPSLLYPYFELDIERDEIRKALLINQETEWIE